MRFLHRWWLLTFFVGPSIADAQDAVPVHKEPHHRLVLDSTRFRILDVQIVPGDTTRFHIHDTAILYVDLAVSPVALQTLGGDWPTTAPAPSARTGDVRMDSGYVLRPVTHRVTNVGSSLFRLLAVTSSGPVRAGERDTEQALPGVTELRSTWFTQSRALVAPQSATEWRTSGSSVLIVQPVSGALEVELADAARQRLAGPGSWTLVPPRARYRITNSRMEPTIVVAIQVR
jgi:quercetin dioxygenase-like cupin family protein